MTVVIPSAPDVPLIGPFAPSMPAHNDLPTPGDLVEFTGRGVAAVWGDVWGWVKHTAAPAAQALGSLEVEIADAVLNAVETYVGTSLGAVSGYLNDIEFYAETGIGLALGTVGLLANEVADAVRGIDVVVWDLLGAVAGIEDGIIPNIEQRLLDLSVATGAFIRLGVEQSERWAIDNIYTPLDAKIWGVGVQAEVDIRDGLSRVLSEAKAYADAHAAAIGAAAAAAAAAAAIATTWIDDCGEPMCQTLGPKTDLGKILKGLHLALDAALFAELANARESDVADAITRIAQHGAALINTFERDFVSGGDTLAGVITRELGNVI